MRDEGCEKAVPTSSLIPHPSSLKLHLSPGAGAVVDPFEELGEVAAILDRDCHRLMMGDGIDPLLQRRGERPGQAARQYGPVELPERQLAALEMEAEARVAVPHEALRTVDLRRIRAGAMDPRDIQNPEH